MNGAASMSQTPSGTNLAAPRAARSEAGKSTSTRVGLPPRTRAQISQEILESVKGISLPVVRASLGYRIAILALAVLLVAISLMFAALIGFLLWLVVWHLYQTFATLKIGPYFVFHAPLAILGGLLLVLLLKPIFFRRRDDMSDVLVLRQE